MGRLDQLDWITRNRLIMKATLPKLEQSRRRWKRKSDRLKVVFWSPTSWERGGLDHMFATALRARGHEVVGMRCGGNMSACSMESIIYPRPSCQYCQDRCQRQLDIWALNDVYRASAPSDAVRSTLKASVQHLCAEGLNHFEHLGISVGALARSDLPSYFMRLVDENDSDVLETWRNITLGLAEHVQVASDFLDRERPDRACLTSGRTTSHSGFYQLCRQRGVPVVTWDEAVGGLGSFIFALNDHAVNYQKPRAWQQLAQEDLSEEEDNFVRYYFSKSSRGEFGRHRYYRSPITEKETICRQLKIDPSKPVTVLLTNLTWDTSALDKAIFFDNMIDWLLQTIEFYLERHDEALVIRTHPAEGHLEDYARGKESVARVLAHHYPELPSHIKVISGHEEINSHVLCDMSTAIVVFTTTVGLEMAVKGRRVMSVGRSHYRGKGFTTDVDHREAYFEMLADPQFRENLFIDKKQVALAKKYAYYFILRTQAYLEEFDQRDRHSYTLPDPEAFLPGHTKRWDRLCESLERLEDFVDCTDFIDPWRNET